ncbi:MAG TPA: hypothetical protein VFZ23_07565 [Pyrinomonadaceae bacterium]
MSRKPVIAVVGAGRDVQPAIAVARELGRLIAENGWILLTGGRDAGVMKAANEGAKEAKDSLTVGILPYRNSDASRAIDVAIVTDTGQARNNIVVLSADVVIACGVEGAGTASEVALAIKNGKPVVLLGVLEVATEFFTKIGHDQIRTANSSREAVEFVKQILQKGSTDV